MGKYSIESLIDRQEDPQLVEKYGPGYSEKNLGNELTGLTPEGQVVGTGAYPAEIEQAVKTPTPTVDAASLGSMIKSNFADDPKTQMAIFAADRFPDVPLQDAMSRYKMVDGKVAFTTGEKLKDGQLKYYFEKPSDAWGKAEKFIAAIPAYGPEVVMSTILGFGGAVAGGASPVPGGAAALGATGAALGAAGGEGLRKTIGGALFDEPQTLEGNVESMGKSAAWAAAGEGFGAAIGGLVNKFARRRTVRDLENLDQPSIDSLSALAEQQGIQLTPAELTGLQSLISRQELLRDLPASEDVMKNFLKIRDEQVQRAVLGMFQDLAPAAKSPTRAFKRGIQTAHEKTQLLEARRGVRTNKIYEDAFNNQKAPVNVRPVIEKLNEWRSIGTKVDPNNPLAGGATREQEIMIDGLLSELTTTSPTAGMGQVPKDSLKSLHQVKIKIDKMIDAIPESPTAKQKFDNVILNEVKTSLLEQMKIASPRYDEARSLYHKLSKPIDAIKDTFAGDIGKLDPKNSNQVGEILFGKDSNPVEVKHARSVISSVDPEAWNGVVRGYMEGFFNKGLKDSSVGAVGNTGGNYRKAMFGSVHSRNMLRAALTPQQYKGVSDVMSVLEATGRAFKPQSATPARQTAKEEMGVEATGVVDALQLVTQPTSPFASMLKGYRTLSMGDYARANAEMITSPTGLAELRKIGRQLTELTPENKAFIPTVGAGLALIMEQNRDEQ
jgi:hypothetical protein